MPYSAMKKVVAALTLTFITSFAFAKASFLPEEGQKPQQWIEVGCTRSTNKGLEADTLFLSGNYHFGYMPFECYAAFQSGGLVTDITMNVSWWPVYFKKKNGTLFLGIDELYHYEHYSHISGEHDIITSGGLLWKTKNNFSITLKIGYNKKIATIFAISQRIDNDDISTTLLADKLWSNGMEAFAFVGSHDDFRYPLFFAPRCSLGIAKNFSSGFRICLEMQSGFTDYFATAVYLNNLQYRFSGRMAF